MTDHRHIVRHSADVFRIDMIENQFAVFIFAHFDMTPELNVDRALRFADFPDVAQFQPLMRNLHLIAVFDLLAEQSVLITDAVTVARQLQRGQRIQEAGG